MFPSFFGISNFENGEYIAQHFMYFEIFILDTISKITAIFQKKQNAYNFNKYIIWNNLT